MSELAMIGYILDNESKYRGGWRSGLNV